MGFGLSDAPAETRAQLDSITVAATTLLGPAVRCVALHGSLAMGSFNPSSSDLDLLVVVDDAPADEAARAFVRRCLELMGRPHPVELSVVRARALDPFVHPAPYELHVSDAHAAELRARLQTAAPVLPGEPRPTDPDLAAHVVMAIARGSTLAGEPLESMCSGVRVEDFASSLFGDLEEIRSDPLRHPVYSVLNSCRLFRLMLDGQLSSKEEGAVWALDVLPPDLCDTVARALSAYRGEAAGEPDAQGVRALVSWCAARIDELRAVREW